MNNLSLDLLNENKSLKETIKGLDRRTREYMEEVDKLTSLLADAQERWASVPMPDYHANMASRDALITKLKGDVLKLQAKVDEQDGRLNVKAQKQQYTQPTIMTGSE